MAEADLIAALNTNTSANETLASGIVSFRASIVSLIAVDNSLISQIASLESSISGLITSNDRLSAALGG